MAGESEARPAAMGGTEVAVSPLGATAPASRKSEIGANLLPGELRDWLGERGLQASVVVSDRVGGAPSRQQEAALRQWVSQRDECFLQQQSLSALGELSASVVHETRNAMAGVLGLAQLHQNEVEGDSATMELIAQEATRCTELLSSFLTVATGSGAPLQLITLDDVLHPVQMLTTPRARARRVEVRYHLPPSSAPFLAHSGELRQILLNLVINALQAVEAGGRVEVRGTVDAAQVSLRVDDDGPGIAEGLASRIFEPFFSTRIGAGGTGLGLPTSRSLARKREGDLWFEPSPLGGASFIVRLPRRSTRPGDPELRSLAARRPAGSDG